MNRDDYLDDLKNRAKEAYRHDREPFVVEVLGKYLEHRSEDAHAWFLYGDSLRILGRSDEAMQPLLNAARLTSAQNLPKVYSVLAQLRESSGNRQEAEEWYEKGVSTSWGRECGWMWILRGANLAGCEDFVGASECHETATKCEGDRDEAYYNWGAVLRAQGKYAEAAEAFNRALEISPEYTVAQEGLESVRDVNLAMQMVAAIPEY